MYGLNMQSTCSVLLLLFKRRDEKGERASPTGEDSRITDSRDQRLPFAFFTFSFINIKIGQ